MRVKAPRVHGRLGGGDGVQELFGLGRLLGDPCPEGKAPVRAREPFQPAREEVIGDSHLARIVPEEPDFRVPLHPLEPRLAVNPDRVGNLLPLAAGSHPLPNLVGRAQQQVKLPPIRFPAGIGGVPEHLLRVRHTLPEDDLVLVQGGRRLLVAADPEVFDESGPLRLRGKGAILLFLVPGNQIAHRSLVPVLRGEVVLFLGAGGPRAGENRGEHGGSQEGDRQDPPDSAGRHSRAGLTRFRRRIYTAGSWRKHS